MDAAGLLENVTCPVTRFGQGLANDLVGWDAHYCTDRVSFTACSDSEHIPVTLHIPGAFSLYNALAALAAAQALSIPIEDAAQAPLTLSGRARQGGGGADGHGLHRAH